jgi:hypothetical protein
MVTGRIPAQRLLRMMTAKDVHVGPTPPPWYLKIKREASQEMRQAQAEKLSRPRAAALVAAQPPPPEPLYDLEEVMVALEGKTKAVIGKFSAFVRPAPVVSTQMKKSEMLEAIRLSLEADASIIPLSDALEFLEE